MIHFEMKCTNQSNLTWFQHGFTVDPHEQSLPHATPAVLQGQPWFVLPVYFVEQVLLHEQEIRFSYWNRRHEKWLFCRRICLKITKIYTTANWHRKKLTAGVSLAPSASIISYWFCPSTKINTNEKYYNETSKTPQNVDKERLYASTILTPCKIQYGAYSRILIAWCQKLHICRSWCSSFNAALPFTSERWHFKLQVIEYDEREGQCSPEELLTSWTNFDSQ